MHWLELYFYAEWGGDGAGKCATGLQPIKTKSNRHRGTDGLTQGSASAKDLKGCLQGKVVPHWA